MSSRLHLFTSASILRLWLLAPSTDALARHFGIIYMQNKRVKHSWTYKRIRSLRWECVCTLGLRISTREVQRNVQKWTMPQQQSKFNRSLGSWSWQNKSFEHFLTKLGPQPCNFISIWSTTISFNHSVLESLALRLTCYRDMQGGTVTDDGAI